MFFKKYFIYFHTNSDQELAPIEMKYKKDMPTLPVLEKEGYKFGAWYLDSEFKLEYNLEKMPKNDVHLYAKWEAITLEEFLNDINYFTKSANILKSLQNDYEGVVAKKKRKRALKRNLQVRRKPQLKSLLLKKQILKRL